MKSVMEPTESNLRTWKQTPRQSVVLADNQAIFRTGAARVLAGELDLEVVVQCPDLPCLKEAIGSFPHSIVLFPTSMGTDLHQLFDSVERAHSKPVIIVDHGQELDEDIALRAEGIIHRSVSGKQLADCLRSVAAGERSIHRTVVRSMPMPDRTGDRVLQRLTPKEMQIVALVGEGCKNKEIASRLGTKEQVIKNYLRTIYDKTGVSDRLELALFTLHHRALAEAAEQVRAQFARTA